MVCGAQLGDDVEGGAFGGAEAGLIEVSGIADGVDLLLGQAGVAGEHHMLADLIGRILQMGRSQDDHLPHAGAEGGAGE